MKKRILIGVAILVGVIVLTVGGFFIYKETANADSKIVRVVKDKLVSSTDKDTEIDFVGKSKVDYNSEEDYYVVSGYMDVYDEYDTDRRAIYVVSVEEGSGDDYKTKTVYRSDDEFYTDNELEEFFTEGYGSYEEDEEEDEDEYDYYDDEEEDEDY